MDYKTIFDKLYNLEENKIIGSFSNGFGNNIKIFNYNHDLISEEDFFNGECVYVKEYNKFGEIIFEGEYKNLEKLYLKENISITKNIMVYIK